MSTWPFVPTPEIFTGNVATVNDPFDANKPNNGARLALGTAVYQTDSTGRLLKYRYVRYSPTAAVVLAAGNTPGIVYWKDATFGVVTPTMSESLTTTLNSVAGWLLNVNATVGNYVFIQVRGFLAAANVAAATALGDNLVGGGAAMVTVRVASGTAPTSKLVAGIALAAVSGGLANVFVCLEDI
jgi:hypothetical protein